MLSKMLKCLISLALTNLYVQAQSEDVKHVIWTDVEESTLLDESLHKVAFRDVVLEKLLTRLINSLLENSRRGPEFSSMPSALLIPDPLCIPNINLQKAKSGVFDINFQGWNLKITGLHTTKIKNLHVVRHLGLQDIRAVVQLVTDLNIEGIYNLTGTGLSLLPLYGSGALNVKISDFLLTGESYIVLKDDTLYIREFQLLMTDNDLQVNLENLMGNGLVGAVANSLLSSVGEDILFNNRNLLEAIARNNWMMHVDNFLSF
ncbi:uncharacterized protein LOC111709950 isoform X2 [Eurytemora carolleeae]|uniref:uncharacterized protein LOC111709950 isoform X2 n=1 Tax=Eurytemora carolleeae TaxID=1294199 RepID=UPI000C784902|nr:uncharacterized protein LOC111709950 isoform X2 [Eurytemora carolleeae]|eukprot:XP_023339699.1 uncharacterized protein LOC111709950 isoform X2 [Eurytemora affinis]